MVSDTLAGRTRTTPRELDRSLRPASARARARVARRKQTPSSQAGRRAPRRTLTFFLTLVCRRYMNLRPALIEIAPLPDNGVGWHYIVTRSKNADIRLGEAEIAGVTSPKRRKQRLTLQVGLGESSRAFRTANTSASGGSSSFALQTLWGGMSSLPPTPRGTQPTEGTSPRCGTSRNTPSRSGATPSATTVESTGSGTSPSASTQNATAT